MMMTPKESNRIRKLLLAVVGLYDYGRKITEGPDDLQVAALMLAVGLSKTMGDGLGEDRLAELHTRLNVIWAMSPATMGEPEAAEIVERAIKAAREGK